MNTLLIAVTVMLNIEIVKLTVLNVLLFDLVCEDDEIVCMQFLYTNAV